MANLAEHWPDRPDLADQDLRRLAHAILRRYRIFDDPVLLEDMVQAAWVKILAQESWQGFDGGIVIFVVNVMRAHMRGVFRRGKQEVPVDPWAMMDPGQRDVSLVAMEEERVPEKERLEALQRLSKMAGLGKKKPGRRRIAAGHAAPSVLILESEGHRRFKEKIIALGWSHQQVAEYLGITVQVLHNKMYGRTAISAEEMARLSQVPDVGHWSWEDILWRVQKSFGVSAIEAKNILAVSMGVSLSSVNRWIRDPARAGAMRLRAALWLAHHAGQNVNKDL